MNAERNFSACFGAVTPYSAALAGAESFLNTIIIGLDRGDLCIPAPKYELSIPAAPKYGVFLSDYELQSQLSANMPRFCGIEIFKGAICVNGHINLSVADGFYEYFARAAAYAFPKGRLCERIELPDSAQYAHARLLMRASYVSGREFRPSALERRALWMCFALLEEDTPGVKRSRAEAAAIRAVMAMLNPRRADLPMEPCCSISAAAMAAIINRFIIKP